jgi:hypothetical protein
VRASSSPGVVAERSSIRAISNHVFKGFGDAATTVPAFDDAAFAFDDAPYSIAYIVHTTAQQHLSAGVSSWFKDDGGRIYIEGRRVLPRRGALQLFISEDGQSPRLLLLTGEDREICDRFIESGNNYETCQEFWEQLQSRSTRQ